MATDDVPVPRALLVAGLVLLAALIAALAFLAGRSSAPLAATSAPPAPATPPPPNAPSEARLPAPAPVVADLAPPVPRPEATPSAPAAGAPARAQVREYFQRVELELASAKSFDDANKAAMAALQDLSGSGVRAIAADQRRLRDKLAAIAAPAPCAEHQRAMLASVDRGIAMLEALADSMATGSTASLELVAEQGREVEKAARAVDTLADAIKREHGL